MEDCFKLESGGLVNRDVARAVDALNVFFDPPRYQASDRQVQPACKRSLAITCTRTTTLEAHLLKAAARHSTVYLQAGIQVFRRVPDWQKQESAPLV